MKQDYHFFKAEFFKTLAHPTRVAILDNLREGEKKVSELQELLDADQSTVSQQLARLRRSNIIVGRKEGTTVYYSVRDPMIFDLLNVARQIFNNHLVSTQIMLDR
jgi:DNA-binding transcriptional ArsR family regulator